MRIFPPCRHLNSIPFRYLSFYTAIVEALEQLRYLYYPESRYNPDYTVLATITGEDLEWFLNQASERTDDLYDKLHKQREKLKEFKEGNPDFCE